MASAASRLRQPAEKLRVFTLRTTTVLLLLLPAASLSSSSLSTTASSRAPTASPPPFLAPLSAVSGPQSAVVGVVGGGSSSSSSLTGPIGAIHSARPGFISDKERRGGGGRERAPARGASFRLRKSWLPAGRPGQARPGQERGGSNNTTAATTTTATATVSATSANLLDRRTVTPLLSSRERQTRCRGGCPLLCKQRQQQWQQQRQ